MNSFKKKVAALLIMINRNVCIWQALWLHRRFLASCWIKHFASTNHLKPWHSTYDIDRLIDNELQLFNSCATIIDSHFDDYKAQATYAATYIMWLKKVSASILCLGFAVIVFGISPESSFSFVLSKYKWSLWGLSFKGSCK